MKTSDTSKDFERIKESDHIKIILESFDKKIPEFFKKIINRHLDKYSSLPDASKLIWNQIINDSIEKYDKDSEAYRDFFSEESIDEFEEINDPKAFKSELRNACPIIRKSLMSKLEEMQEWKEDFAYAKPQELLDTFANFLDFVRDYIDKTDEEDYKNFISFEDFSDMEDVSEDADLSLQSVIGSGIKTTVIYNINPQFFFKSVRRTLYGMYFLTTDVHDQMPSKTSEFVMIDDAKKYVSKRGSNSNFRIEHNYWYPFNIFMFYSKRIFEKLKNELEKNKISVDVKKRYIYVNAFLDQVCMEHQEAIKTMMGGDQDL